MLKKTLILLIVILGLIAGCEKTSKPQETVATPVITPASGMYLSNQTVQITCTTSGAAIRYTLDGSEPTATSTLYSAAIQVTGATTVKAKGFKNGMQASATATATYTFGVASISVYPLSGTYSTPQTVTISTITPGTVVHYTTDGSEPTENSATFAPPLIIDGNVTLKAKGFISGWDPSPTVTVVYTFNATKPTFSETAGIYYSNFNVTLSSPTTGSEIRYTTDGSMPTTNSTLYTAPLEINQSTNLKARTFKTNWNPSPADSAYYEMKVTAVSFAPAPGYFSVPQNVVMSTPTPGAVIYYTTNGSDPTSSSSQYTTPVTLNQNTTLKARALKNNWTGSNISSGGYTFTVSTPVFDPVPGVYSNQVSVAINSATTGADIRYTTDGSDPTSNSTLYTNPVNMTHTTLLKAKAFKTNWNSSGIVSGNYTITTLQTVATPVFNPASGAYPSPRSVEISCATQDATIRYNLGTAEPTETSTEYTGPISVVASQIITAKAFKTGMNPSNSAAADYSINFTLGEMVSIPGGTFTMGRNTGTGEADEVPTHSVTLNSFLISKYEVTQLEWQNVMGSNPSFFTGEVYRPVETVSWYAALVYCNKRSVLAGLDPVYSIGGSTNPDNWGAVPELMDATWNTVECNWTANGFRLPTEAEWEYAARGATNNPDYQYAGSNNIDNVAWYQMNSGGESQMIGYLQPNGLGLYDMSGNISEWCWDWYGNTYYNESPLSNPTGPSSSSYRVTRGGSCNGNNVHNFTVVDRNAMAPNHHSSSYGLRVVRKAPTR